MSPLYQTEWPRDFPKGYGHTSISYLKRCIGYEAAKNGNLHAGELVVFQCIKEKRIEMLRQTYPDAWLLPVITKNALPIALAESIGLPVYYCIRCISVLKRSRMTAMERLLHKPDFVGFAVSGRYYIIVDDVVTQGGTICALMQYICQQGGYVVAVVALAYSIGSSIIVPNTLNLLRLILKFGSSLPAIFQKIDVVGSLALSNAQASYICRFANFRNFENKFENVNASMSPEKSTYAVYEP